MFFPAAYLASVWLHHLLGDEGIEFGSRVHYFFLFPGPFAGGRGPPIMFDIPMICLLGVFPFFTVLDDPAFIRTPAIADLLYCCRYGTTERFTLLLDFFTLLTFPAFIR